MNFLAITDDMKYAKELINARVDYIFIDLERLGKHQRQGGTSSFISTHTLASLAKIRAEFPTQKILVRINPLHSATERELNEIFVYRPSAIMLPMFRSLEELTAVADMIDGRCEFWPLAETWSAVTGICDEPHITGLCSKVYFGLNDLHLELNRRFMFSVLLEPRLNDAMEFLCSIRMEFGFGGIAPVNKGLISGADVLLLHRFFGSQNVILSQSFRNAIECQDVAHELSRLRLTWEESGLLTAPQLDKYSSLILDRIQNIEAGGDLSQ